ncbi:MAG: hypothetical protein ACD_51C00206G0006 [uncultured bacterium]|nr:MAG: hypothetical protein ACD_51C00206G0006 [uncultured bacterium]OGJ48085.1 MAG: DNA protecting protein DprA [Candidatus Peregrinibacteria bacterium RIFOXYA2_FULL_41_18]OGJ48258.1 MAG: DNA protecting protein DprA [Candidatus Peregrinibacteria bacterium RIFOXYB12_FULL_41_12]OGJ52927.1 MAG: DNA protecting protein DprA [Candidatus Peregrinibacteria bacterium RIFOXYC2_FULL_41_22]
MDLIYLNALQNHLYDRPRTLIAILKKHNFNARRAYEQRKDAKHSLRNNISCFAEAKLISEIKNKNLDPEKDYERLQKLGMKILAITDANYPENLKNTSCPPVILYYKGELECLKNPRIAIVGTRKISTYGKRAVSAITDKLAEYKITVVSGLAYGIDTDAHTKSLKKNMPNIAVLANGLDQIYPTENKHLADEIIARGGLIISESPPGVPSQKFMFPIRNRIIAGISDATIVVEAPQKSGALITADYAFSENRLVYAVPGEFDSYRQSGCHKLIKSQKAVLLDDPSQVIDDITPTQLKLEFSRENNQLANLLGALTHEPTHINTIAKSLNSNPQSLISNLLDLEMMGKVKNVGGMCYVKL